MGVENILIGKPFDSGKLIERQIEFCQKRSVFDKLDFLEVFFSIEISEIASRFKIMERVERHGLTSLR